MTRTRMCVLAFALTTMVAFAIPQQINYQGQLTAPNGTPLDTTVSMLFRIYNAPSGGAFAWSETHPAVTVEGGLFSVRLGSITPLTDNFNVDRWLGIIIGNNSEMTPRQQIISVAHAYRVGTVDGASGGTISGKLNVGTNNTNTGTLANAFGQDNIASGTAAVASGGRFNRARGPYSVIGGGGGPTESDSNSAQGTGSTVGGGRRNFAQSFGTVSGGLTNWANGGQSTVSGGSNNAATGNSSSVGGGDGNSATDLYATVSGGHDNLASGAYSAIGGGLENLASGGLSTVCGGLGNTASNSYATVAGGRDNTASGFYSFAAGVDVTVAGTHSSAMGAHVSVNADSAFAWSDGSGPLFSIGADNTYNLKANGGFRFWTTANHANNIGARLPAGGSAWVALSDSTKKRNIRNVNTKQMLDRVTALPIKQWSYISQDEGIEHVGPMAQDFWNEFHLGDDSLSISTIDPSGIALAAIQELAKRTERIEQLERELADLKAIVLSQPQYGLRNE